MTDESNFRTNYWKIFAADAEGRTTRLIRRTIGRNLQKMYSSVVEERLPQTIADRLHRLNRKKRCP